MKGSRVRGDLDEAPESGGMSRRTLARTTAWTAPIAVVAVAAPAYAASVPCVGGQAVLVQGTSPTVLGFSPSAVTAAVSYSTTGWAGDPTPGETGEVHPTDYTPAWNYLKLHHPAGMDQGDTITLTLAFSQPVLGLTLTITDIDKATGQWIDQVIVDTLGFVAAPAANVVGAGTSANPFTTKVDSGISSALGDLKLTWAGPLSVVQLTYRAGDVQNSSGIGQHIGVGRIGFSC